METKKPNCHDCVHCLPVPGDAHKRCNNKEAQVTGIPYGIRQGWFLWPVNFDPTWLASCDGFSDNPEDKKPVAEYNPFLELASMFAKRL